MSASYTGCIVNVIRLFNETLAIFTQNKNNVVMSKATFSPLKILFFILCIFLKSFVCILLWSEVLVSQPNTDTFIAGFSCFAEPKQTLRVQGRLQLNSSKEMTFFVEKQCLFAGPNKVAIPKMQIRTKYL